MSTRTAESANSAHARVTALVFCCFLLTSTGWLLWMNCLTNVPSPLSVEFATMVCSYLIQACGIGVYMACARTHPRLVRPQACIALAILYVASLIPSVWGHSSVTILASGAISNSLCGVLQGFYLACLAQYVDKSRRGTVFGIGYAAATFASWLLDKLSGGMLLGGVAGIGICCALMVPTIVALFRMVGFPDMPHENTNQQPLNMRTLMIPCLLVLLVSLTNNLGYGFPHTDLLKGVDLSSSRLFYGVGLIIAGLVSDKNRTYGMLFCACSLIVPLLSLALAGARIPATVLWALGYLLAGFFSVFRITLMADLTCDAGIPEMAGAGLMLGRIGDAAGTAICLALSPSTVVLMVLICCCFAACLLLFYALLQQSEQASRDSAPTEEELLERFVNTYELSNRQVEVARLLLAGHTNQQIASELVVSDNTVKFHVRNVLKKVDCKNRQDLQQIWSEFKENAI